MKKILTLFTAIMLSLPAISQSCLPEGITFTNQIQIDNFQNNYPGCTQIDGDVAIVSDGIINLEGLGVIQYIGGSFSITDCDSINNLSGLSQLVSITGDFSFEENETITDFTGLHSLASIEGNFTIQGNNGLQTLEGLDALTSIGGNLFIASNGNLEETRGMTNLESIGGDLYFYNGDNQFITGFESLTTVNGALKIEYNNVEEINFPVLESVGGNLYFYYNPSLNTLQGMESLSSIGGKLSIWQNVNLTDISALSNIDENSITDLFITLNSSLADCSVLSICEYLASPNGTVTINNNKTGCNSQQEVNYMCSVGIENSSTPLIRIHIYPNPASDMLYIVAEEEIESVSIFTGRGEEVRGGRGDEQTNGRSGDQAKDHLVRIPLNGLAPGLYLVRVDVANEIVSKKIIIMR